MSIHLSGSLAFDRIMTFPGHFEEHLLPEKLHILNVCFLIDRIEEKRGGTAGNIAYNLSLLGERPCIYSSVGKDFASYGKALKALGIQLDGVRHLDENFTACAYITTDQKGNQITGFSPSAMNTPCDPAYHPKPVSGDWAVVGPGNVQDMVDLPALYRTTKTPFIFDPGQQIPALGPDALLAGLSGAFILIGNDYEIELICKMTGLNKAQLMQRVDWLITTLGDAGSEIMCKDWDKSRHVGAVTLLQMVDPTGAGDAYRAGLVKGLHNGLDVESAAELGTVSASFCIEKYGTQEHSFTFQSYCQRFEQTFGVKPALSW